MNTETRENAARAWTGRDDMPVTNRRYHFDVEEEDAALNLLMHRKIVTAGDVANVLGCSRRRARFLMEILRWHGHVQRKDTRPYAYRLAPGWEDAPDE